MSKDFKHRDWENVPDWGTPRLPKMLIIGHARHGV